MRQVLLAAALLASTSPSFAGPKIGVVVGTDAPKLEHFAADELAVQFKQLFDAEVTVSDKVPLGVDHIILVGSPKTNPLVAKAVSARRPKLTAQGHVLLSVALGDNNALVVGGGSPVATLWAAYELGHYFGIRSLPHGDILPEKVPELKLDGLDVVLEPVLQIREWTLLDADPVGFGTWGIDDYTKFLRQLAKLKFNRIRFEINPKDPPLPLGGRRFVVAGDTPGRKAFKGIKEFENPAVVGKTTDGERRAAIAGLAKQLGEAATGLGMELNQGDSTLTPHGSTKAYSLLPGSLRVVEDRLRAGEYSLEAVPPSDAEIAAYYLSRRAFDPKASYKSAISQIFTPGIGAAANERAALGFDMIEKAVTIIARNDPQAVDVSPDSLVKQLKIAEPPPVWWEEASKQYAGAMNEMYRSIRATFNDPARPSLLYHAKRCEFGMHYLTALQSTRLAGVARSKGDRAMQVIHLEKAVESMYNALNALGDVARDPSDRGVIAVLAEDAYRPLMAELKVAERK